jgi:hypothetical protein
VLLCHRSAGRRWYPDVVGLSSGHVKPVRRQARPLSLGRPSPQFQISSMSSKTAGDRRAGPLPRMAEPREGADCLEESRRVFGWAERGGPPKRGLPLHSPCGPETRPRAGDSVRHAPSACLKRVLCVTARPTISNAIAAVVAAPSNASCQLNTCVSFVTRAVTAPPPQGCAATVTPGPVGGRTAREH